MSLEERHEETIDPETGVARDRPAWVDTPRWNEVAFTALFEQNTIGLALVDGYGRPFATNQALHDILGYSDEELPDIPFPPFAQSDDLETDRELFQEFARGESEHYRREKPLTRKDGETVECRITGAPVRDAAGRLLHVILMLEEITEIRRTEAALRDTGRRYSQILSTLANGLLIFDPDGRITYVDKEAERIFGLSRDEMVGQRYDHPFWNLRTPDGLPFPPEAHPVARVMRTLEPAKNVEMARRRTNGSTVTWSATTTPLTDPDGDIVEVIVSIRDVTARRRAEESLARSERRYRNLFEDAPVMYVTTREEAGLPVVEDCNGLFLSTLGYEQHEVIGRTLTDFYTPESRDRLLESGGHARVLGGQVVHEERQLVAREGTTIDVLVREVPELDPQGQVTRTRAAYVDITDRKLAEETLRETEAKYRTMVEQNPAVAYVAPVPDANEPFLYISPRIEELLGYATQEWTTDPGLWRRCLHPEDAERAIAGSEAAETTRGPYMGEYRLVGREGQIVWIQDRANVVTDEQDRPIFWHGLMIDITDRKRAEEEVEQTLSLLRETDKKRRELLGRLVRAQEDERRRIAEDLHDDPIQQLTAAGIRLEMLAQSEETTGKDAVLRIRKSVETTIGKLRSLMFDLRPPALDREGLPAALNQFLAETAKDAGFQFSLEDRMVTELAAEDRAILYRIAHEVITNVRKHANAERVSVLLESREDGVRLKISDNGVGFVPAEVARPKPGHLGLASIRERAELRGGWCRVMSTPGEGTTVEVWLPGDAD